MTDTAVPAPPGGSPDRTRAAAAVLLLTIVLALLLLGFAWPAARSAVHGVPLGVAGPAAAAEQVERDLAEQRPGAFEVTRYPDEAAARAAVGDREVYGAVVTGPGGPAVLTASAGSATLAQAIGQLGPALAAATGRPVRVEDVVPAPAGDPRGAGLGAAMLPLVLGGILTAGLLGVLVAGRWLRLGAALVFAVVGGAALAGVLRWIGAVPGSYAEVAGVLALGLAAISTTLLGLESLLGRPGLALGSVTMVALGNPLSGAASAPEMLPDGWGRLGTLLPPGAEVTLLRSVAFFDGGGAGALTVLLGWLAAGLLLVAAGAARQPVPAGTTRRLVPV